MGKKGSFPWVKRPGREADHSVPTSSEVKKTWMYKSAPPYVFMVKLTNLSIRTTLPFLHLHYKQIRQQEPVGSSKNFVYSNIRDISEGYNDVQYQYRTNSEQRTTTYISISGEAQFCGTGLLKWPILLALDDMENCSKKKFQGKIGLEENLPYYHIIDHKFHMERPGREQDPGVCGVESGLTAWAMARVSL
jgi:hypothetical protein